MLLLFSCTKKRDDDMIFMYNFSVPKTLSFDLTTQTVLQVDRFDLDLPDTLTMQKLDRVATIEMINTIAEVGSGWGKRINELAGRPVADTVYHGYDDTSASFHETNRFYVYGKLDLQPDINSIVLYEIEYFEWMDRWLESFWLLNLKDNKLYSAARLDFLMAKDSKSGLENNIFTEILEDTRFESMDFKFLRRLDCAITALRKGYPEFPAPDCFVKTYYTKYKLNEEGYIEFVK